VALAAAAAAAPWASSQTGSAGNRTTGCLERFDPAVDYFPDKVVLEDAEHFTVEYRRSFKVVTVREPYPGGGAERYVLLQCGAPAPPLSGDLAGAQVIPVPITSMFSMSTTHIPLLAGLDRLNVLTGVSTFQYVDAPDVEARIRAGQVVEFSRAGMTIDVERVVTSRPSLVMAGGATTAALSVIRSAGVPVVSNSEWLEPTMLARAEWLKYMAAFLNEERRAEEGHRAMKARYGSLSARARAVPAASRPTVMTGRSTRGTFVIAGGRSYVAGAIADAGGRYVWADDTATGSSSVDLEAQVRRAVNADIWINGGGWKDRAAMLEDEPRYAEFKAFRTGQVWVYERRVRPGGANDYWSRSVVQPDLVLADLVRIFHPSLLPNHSFEWYMQVPAR
jgi:iron complex transport system substrate-binding protein